MIERTRGEKLQRAAARMLMRLPESLQLKMSGKPPVVIDGERLHPQLQLLLSLMERTHTPRMSDLEPVLSRARTRRDSLAYAGRAIPVASVRDLTIEGPESRLGARHYAPERGAGRPLLVYYHGGGFVLCDLDTHDQICRFLCRHAGVHVLSIGYRLAPEHPYPAAVHDAEAAFEWGCDHATSLGADPARVAVAGDSAGGNLSVVVALHRKAAGRRMPWLQLLVYPAIDRTREWRSLELFADGFLLTRRDIDWFGRHYGAAPVALQDRDLRGMPPAIVVTAPFDPLRDEGEAYARALEAAGVEVRLMRMPGMIHGFMNLIDLSPACRAALGEVAEALKRKADPPAAGRGQRRPGARCRLR